jgi:hypothetical protein
MGRRALVGTTEAYEACGTCGHVRLHHEARGTGRCTRIVTVQRPGRQGLAVNVPARCPCTGHTPTERTH